MNLYGSILKINFNCSLSILENGEHYFHTKEQLEFYENWIDKTII